MVGIKNEDWEDLAIGPSILGDTSTYIYLGDIGDNKKNKTIKKIHFFREPKIKDFDNELIEINDIKTISFYCFCFPKSICNSRGPIHGQSKVEKI